MPNWCDNTATITFPTEEEANAFKTYCHDGLVDSIFQYFKPLKDSEDWFWDRVNEWGTKWDASGVDVHWQDDTSVVLNFSTAWSPPIGVYEKMSENSISVEASYYEPGMCFVGTWKDGLDEFYEYANFTSSEIPELIGEELDMIYNVSTEVESYENDLAM
jgi:hypothetical protein